MIKPSLELGWLKESKGISLPNIVFDNVTGCQGRYYQPMYNEAIINGKSHSLEKGLIVINDNDGECDISTIAHEFRHHLHYLHGVFDKFETKKFNFDLPYDDAIVDYFTTCWYEFDALVYEMNHHINYCNDYWFNLITKETNNKNLYNLIWRKRKTIMI